MAKRIFDLVFTIPGIIILLPVFIGLSFWIKLDSTGPIIFKQKRVGKDGKDFYIYKFRTMVVNASELGPSITVGDDPRITKSGKVLRRYKLDELPQLFNVLKGEMSLVGPRPEVRPYVEKYNKQEKLVLKLKPGITDPASIKYRNESELLATYEMDSSNEYSIEDIYIKEIMPEKIRINLEYADKANILTDFLVILRTVFG